jgi:hypothetical protein
VLRIVEVPLSSTRQYARTQRILSKQNGAPGTLPDTTEHAIALRRLCGEERCAGCDRSALAYPRP